MSNINFLGKDLTINRKKNNKNITSKDYSTVWNTKKIDYYKKCIEDGIKTDLSSPFYDGNVDYRKSKINFVYTPDEIEEMKKCKNDLVYFAEKYCYTMTPKGVLNVSLRKYQKRILRSFQQNNKCVFLAARQSNKTTTSAFFIMWFMIFNYEKNVFIAANKLDTTIEVIDKVKTVYEHLPYFMKPGVVINNVKKIEFDNKCRIIGQATTPKPGLGFSIHLLYCDEFAHIPSHILNPFWENLFPVVSADPNAKIIITSTANGLNKFSQIYTDAIKSENDFTPIRVDWWEVPGRDDEWKRKEIANFGSESAFNQQYGNQFLSSDSILFDTQIIQLWERIKTKFEWRYIDLLEDYDYDYKGLIWNPKFDFDEITKYDQFIFAIDPADGVGRDFTVCNIFQIVPLSKVNIRKVKVYKSETDFFSLKQVGMFRANDISLEIFSNIVNTLAFKFFEPENICAVIEINDNRGNTIITSFENTKNYEERMIFHTYHSKNSKFVSPGVKINSQLKQEYTNRLRSLVRSKKLLIYEENTLTECTAFGLNDKGAYTSQIGLDDIVMSLVNLVPFFDSFEFPDRVEEIYDYLDVTVKNEINKVMDVTEIEDFNDIDYSILDDYM